MNDDSLAGVLDIVATEEADLHDKTAPVKTETKTEAPKTETKTETKTENKKVEAEAEDDSEEAEDVQDFSRVPYDEREDDAESETTEPSQTQTKTETENKTADKVEEKADENAPRFDPEPVFNLPTPQYDEQGYITNMTPQEYENYVIQRAQFNFQHQAWATGNENKALDAAEQILPEIKTSAAVRQMVENARVASILNGQQINSYEAAKLVKDALGLSNVDQKVAQAKAEGKAEGERNAKVSITIQKNAAVETPSPKRKSADPKQTALTKRLKAGDESAFEDLLTQWDKDGKL